MKKNEKINRIRFDVCGVIYCIEKRFLDAGPISKLTKLCANVDPTTKDNVIYINRPPDLFNAILTLYLTGDLHIPMTSCPSAFLKEMEFWEIDAKNLSNCCFYKLQCHLEEQKTLLEFHRHIVDQEDDVLVKGFAQCASIAHIRARVWSIVDYRGSGIFPKIQFVLALLMILLSIMTISLGTCDMFRRNMTNCERLEFMEATDMEHLDIFAGLIREQDCTNTTLPQSNGLRSYPQDLMQSGEFIYILVPINEKLTGNNNNPKMLSRGQNLLSVRVPDMKVPMRVLVVLDLLTLAFFTVDFFLRVLSCPSIFSYFKSIINIADTAALIGTYMHLVLLQVYKEQKYKDEWVDVLALMQVLRSLRLFRLVRNITAARVLAYTFYQNLKDLSVLLLFIIVGVCTFSSILYIFEHDQFNIANVPIGWYWALITMTTVGYGDIKPVSVSGRIVGCICAVTGVLLFALTVPIFAGYFLALYQYANLKCFAKLDCKEVNAPHVHARGIELSERVIATTSGQQSASDISLSGETVVQR